MRGMVGRIVRGTMRGMVGGVLRTTTRQLRLATKHSNILAVWTQPIPPVSTRKRSRRRGARAQESVRESFPSALRDQAGDETQRVRGVFGPLLRWPFRVPPRGRAPTAHAAPARHVHSKVSDSAEAQRQNEGRTKVEGS